MLRAPGRSDTRCVVLFASCLLFTHASSARLRVSPGDFCRASHLSLFLLPHKLVTLFLCHAARLTTFSVPPASYFVSPPPQRRIRELFVEDVAVLAGGDFYGYDGFSVASPLTSMAECGGQPPVRKRSSSWRGVQPGVGGADGGRACSTATSEDLAPHLAMTNPPGWPAAPPPPAGAMAPSAPDAAAAAAADAYSGGGGGGGWPLEPRHLSLRGVASTIIDVVSVVDGEADRLGPPAGRDRAGEAPPTGDAGGLASHGTGWGLKRRISAPILRRISTGALSARTSFPIMRSSFVHRVKALTEFATAFSGASVNTHECPEVQEHRLKRAR